MLENKIMNTAENIMGVHRNFSAVGKNYKILIIMRIVFETVVCVAVYCQSFLVFSPNLKLRGNVSRLMVVFHLAFLLNGFSIITCAVQSSHSFELFKNNFREAQYCFWNIDIYKKYIQKFKTIFLIASSSFTLLNAILITLRIYGSATHVEECYIVLFLIEIYIEIRYLLENIIFYIYISIIQYLLKSMNTTISDIKAKCTELEKKPNSYSLWNDLMTMGQVEEWAMKYQKLESCSNKLSACFSSQVTACKHNGSSHGFARGIPIVFLHFPVMFKINVIKGEPNAINRAEI